jgi:hypothetical protein
MCLEAGRYIDALQVTVGVILVAANPRRVLPP